jgi:hypothetical protein
MPSKRRQHAEIASQAEQLSALLTDLKDAAQPQRAAPLRLRRQLVQLRRVREHGRRLQSACGTGETTINTGFFACSTMDGGQGYAPSARRTVQRVSTKLVNVQFLPNALPMRNNTVSSAKRKIGVIPGVSGGLGGSHQILVHIHSVGVVPHLKQSIMSSVRGDFQPRSLLTWSLESETAARMSAFSFHIAQSTI